MKIDNATLEISEIDFLHQIQKELSLDSAEEAVALVASVLQTLRQTLTDEGANQVLNKLPDFLKIIFATNWRRDEDDAQVEHLDEFVCLFMNRERESGNKKSYFNNEVQALSVLVLTLKQLDKLVDLNSIDGLSLALLHELREIPAEEAA